MSRALTDIVRAYKNMDIENMPSDAPKQNTKGLLSKTRNFNSSSALDINNPNVRIAKQMQIVRRHRDEIKNGRSN